MCYAVIVNSILINFLTSRNVMENLFQKFPVSILFVKRIVISSNKLLNAQNKGDKKKQNVSFHKNIIICELLFVFEKC